MTIGFVPVKKNQPDWGWITIDGKRYVPVRKDKNGHLVIFLYSDHDWQMMPTGKDPRRRKGTVRIMAAEYGKRL